MFLIVISVTAKHAWAATASRLKRRESEFLGPWLVSLFTALGPTFIKAGQLACMRQDLLPDRVTNSLRQLWMDAGDLPQWDVEAAVRQGLGDRASAIASITRTPLGSGCFALVHAAVLRDGRPIAIKVRRPRVSANVHADLAIMRSFLPLIQRLPALSGVPLRSAFERMAFAIEQQLDFDEERKAHESMIRSFGGVHSVWIPSLLPALCSDSVLVMEHIPKATPIQRALLSSAEATRLADRLVRVVFKMIFEDGLVHVDLHPGNLMVSSGHYLVLLDFGFVVRLSEDEREAFSSFFLGVATNDSARCLDVIIRCAEHLPAGLDERALLVQLESLLGDYQGLVAKDFSVAAFVRDLFALQRRFGIVGTPGFTGAILGLFVVEPVVRQLDGHIDFQGIAQDMLVRSMFHSPIAI